MPFPVSLYIHGLLSLNFHSVWASLTFTLALKHADMWRLVKSGECDF